ncbi:MAG: TIGR03084 family metal-binding protein [Microthrixaceae bacterium]
MTDVREVAADLHAEQAALDAVVAELSEDQWGLPTPSAGWTVADQIGHLTYFDGAAATAVTDPDGFQASIQDLVASPDAGAALTLGRGQTPAALLAAWRTNRERLAEVAATLTDDQRIAWYGPSMGAKSFLTARLMECWAHGQDIVDTVGADRPPTDRVRHIARLGFITRGWSYINRGMDVPAGEVRVELTGPSGAVWRLGPDDATDVVTGPAVDFCLVVTQRRHVDDTALEVDGAVARDWMERAQAFAGGPTDGPTPAGS